MATEDSETRSGMFSEFGKMQIESKGANEDIHITYDNYFIGDLIKTENVDYSGKTRLKINSWSHSFTNQELSFKAELDTLINLCNSVRGFLGLWFTFLSAAEKQGFSISDLAFCFDNVMRAIYDNMVNITGIYKCQVEKTGNSYELSLPLYDDINKNDTTQFESQDRIEVDIVGRFDNIINAAKKMMNILITIQAYTEDGEIGQATPVDNSILSKSSIEARQISQKSKIKPINTDREIIQNCQNQSTKRKSNMIHFNAKTEHFIFEIVKYFPRFENDYPLLFEHEYFEVTDTGRLHWKKSKQSLSEYFDSINSPEKGIPWRDIETIFEVQGLKNSLSTGRQSGKKSKDFDDWLEIKKNTPKSK
ncbi:hypothetical protein AGMMS49579_13120 [Spirochaetia bacterium]|nr:hypothetical protein AGMMS49579_13120 [Spirochaetia bacterium]